MTYADHLNTLTVPKLKEIAFELGLTVTSRMRKAEIVTLVVEHEESLAERHVQEEKKAREDSAALSQQVAEWHKRHNYPNLPVEGAYEKVAFMIERDHKEALAFNFLQDFTRKNNRRFEGYKSQSSHRKNKVPNIMRDGAKPKRSPVFTSRQQRRMFKKAQKAMKMWNVLNAS